MWAWVLARGERVAYPLRLHALFFAVGVCLFSMNFVLFYYGGLTIPSGLLAVVFSLASIGNLLEELSNQRRLARSRVAHQEEMAALLLAANSEDLASGPPKQQRRNRHGVACCEADSVTALQPIELRCAKQFRAAQCLAPTHPAGHAPVARVLNSDRNRDGDHCYQHPPGDPSPAGDGIRLNLPGQLRAGRIRPPCGHAHELQAFGTARNRSLRKREPEVPARRRRELPEPVGQRQRQTGCADQKRRCHTALRPLAGRSRQLLSQQQHGGRQVTGESDEGRHRDDSGDWPERAF